MRIEGVPEGWEAVAFRKPVAGELCLGLGGLPFEAQSEECHKWLIIRRIEPVCTWRHGVFADGWIAEDKDGDLCFYHELPHANTQSESWNYSTGRVSLHIIVTDEASMLLCQPVFRPDLPWTARIQRVGPTIEATIELCKQ